MQAYDDGKLVKNLVLDLTADKNKYDWNKNLVKNGIVQKALLVDDFEDSYHPMLIDGIELLLYGHPSCFYKAEQRYKATFDFGKGDTTVCFDLIGDKRSPYRIEGEKEKFEAFMKNQRELFDDFIDLRRGGEEKFTDETYNLLIEEFSDISYKKAVKRLKELNEPKNKQTLIFANQIALMDNELTRPDCCFLVRENEVKALDKCTDKEIRKEHNLEAMYKSGAFD